MFDDGGQIQSASILQDLPTLTSTHELGSPVRIASSFVDLLEHHGDIMNDDITWAIGTAYNDGVVNIDYVPKAILLETYLSSKPHPHIFCSNISRTALQRLECFAMIPLDLSTLRYRNYLCPFCFVSPFGQCAIAIEIPAWGSPERQLCLERCAQGVPVAAVDRTLRSILSSIEEEHLATALYENYVETVEMETEELCDLVHEDWESDEMEHSSGDHSPCGSGGSSDDEDEEESIPSPQLTVQQAALLRSVRAQCHRPNSDCVDAYRVDEARVWSEWR